jgi:hypothetical protein
LAGFATTNTYSRETYMNNVMQFIKAACAA